MKKNVLYTAIQVSILCGIFLSANQLLSLMPPISKCNELIVPKYENFFPYVARGHQDKAHLDERKTFFRVSKQNWLSKSPIVYLTNPNTFVMAKLITAYNGDYAGKAFEYNFFDSFLNNYYQCSSLSKALVSSFEYQAKKVEHGPSGATALIAVFFQDKIAVAGVGDSKAFLCSKRGVVNLVHECTFKNKDELVRLWSCPYCLSDEGLPVTRAFGFDEKYADYIAPIPEIHEFTIKDDYTFLILATNEFDLSEQEILKATMENSTTEELSAALVKKIPMKSKQDLEIMIIKLVIEPLRSFRQKLTDCCGEMFKLYNTPSNPENCDACWEYCKKYKEICDRLYSDENFQTKICYQTNDCLYDVLFWGFQNFCFIKKHFLLTTPVIKAISSFHKILSFVVDQKNDLLDYFPKKQQKKIKFWGKKISKCLG